MTAKLLLIGLLSISTACWAGGYVCCLVPQNMYGAQVFSFGVSTPPADTCSNWSRQFIFDATTTEGKNILSILLAAKLTNTKIAMNCG